MSKQAASGGPETESEPGMTVTWVNDELPLERILTEWVPGSFDQPWTWDDEERDVRERECCCRSHMCETPDVGPVGHYQAALEAHVAANGIPGRITLGDDGRVWDGHHRVIAARSLGIATLAVEIAVPLPVQETRQ